MTDVKAPAFPESVQDGIVAVWNKNEGDQVALDEVIAEIETDKVVLEIVAPAAGVLKNVLKQEGDTVTSTEKLAEIDEAAASSAPAEPESKQPEEKASESKPEKEEASSDETKAEPADKDSKQAPEPAEQPQSAPAADQDQGEYEEGVVTGKVGPAARKAARELGVDAESTPGTGPKGAVTKSDIESAPKPKQPTEDQSIQTQDGTPLSQAVGERVEKRVPMTRLRKRVAERLLSATQETAMLTTFNEVNMQPIIDMRKGYQERFEDRHGVRLGFMSFFVKACTEALKRFPAVNASIDDQDIVYHGYYDIGVAVSTERGLVVPILKDTDRMNLAEVEKKIIQYGKKARDNKLELEDISGGTFTISNGGVFGSLLSTPILNPPQTAILGMHKIQERPMAVNGEVKILPMMYLALSYDHRMIDGKEAVQFLTTVKELVEDPALLLLDL